MYGKGQLAKENFPLDWTFSEEYFLSAIEECHQPKNARPNLEAFAGDVYGTGRKAGYPVRVVKDYDEKGTVARSDGWNDRN